VEIEGDYLIAGAEKAVRLTDGLSNCVHAQALQPFLSNSSYGTVVYKGYLGDELMGYHGSRTLLADCSREGTLKAFLDHEPCIVPPAEQSRLLAEQMRPLTDHALETCESLLASFEATTTLERIIAFCLQQRQRRMTLNGVHLVRSQRTVRTPFCDNDLVDFMLAAPPGLRLDRYLMKKTFTERFPALAKVPFTGTGLPLTTCFEDLWIRFKSQASWRVRAAGLKSFPVPRVAPYTDYAGWMRAHLRGWVEETLLSERALERGYFCPVRLRQLVAEHMDGSDHSMKLGQLLSIELWHRQFLD
jgi:asparagine synthetase B (glutamine-hydrolysing)